MAWLLLLIFVGVPLVELSVLIEVGSDIGALATVALCLLTAAVGLSLIRMQGLKVLADLQTASAKGEAIVEPLVHGFFLLVAGVCLFFPGFITDAIGGLLLIPPVRLALGRAGLAGAAAKSTRNFRYSRYSESGKATIVIDGDFAEVDDEKAEAGANDQMETNPDNANPDDANPWVKRDQSGTSDKKNE